MRLELQSLDRGVIDARREPWFRVARSATPSGRWESGNEQRFDGRREATRGNGPIAKNEHLGLEWCLFFAIRSVRASRPATQADPSNRDSWTLVTSRCERGLCVEDSVQPPLLRFSVV